MERIKINTQSKQYQSLVRRLRTLGLDVMSLLKEEPADAWQAVKGILSKKPSGSSHQRAIRKEWV